MKKSPIASVAVPIVKARPMVEPWRRPTRQEAEEAVRTLLAWAGDDPARPGLRETPARVTDAYGEYFSGYKADAAAELATTFEDPAGYGDMVLLKDIRFESHCEHHIAPFYGVAHVAYIPSGRIVGLSKLARVVEIHARRLQTQEALTSEIASAIMHGLDAKGAAVMLSAEHQCISMRGVRQHDVKAITMRLLGAFESEDAWRSRFLSMVQSPQVEKSRGD
jgi:GTP cyclohydrolase IA